MRRICPQLFRDKFGITRPIEQFAKAKKTSKMLPDLQDAICDHPNVNPKF